MRTISFHNDFCPDELARELLSAGFPSTATLAEIPGGRIPDDADETIFIECVVDEDDVVAKLGDDAILTAAADIQNDGRNERDIEDAIRYARSGDRSLSLAMFERVFDGGNLHACERALS